MHKSLNRRMFLMNSGSIYHIIVFICICSILINSGCKTFTGQSKDLIKRNLVFGEISGRQLLLNLYLPKKGKPPYPAVVFIHGGGWNNEVKSQFAKQSAYLANKGIASACIEHRLYGEATFPAAIEDCKCAVRWMRANAEKYDINPEKIAAAGASSGGHLAALLGMSGGVQELEGTGGNSNYSSRINLVISFNGVFDLEKQYRRYLETKWGPENPIKLFIGGSPEELPEKYKAASPIMYIDGTDSPVLLLHGTDDTTFPYEQSVKFKELLEKAGVPVELFSAEGAGHGFFNRPPFYQPTLERMEEFLNKYFR